MLTLHELEFFLLQHSDRLLLGLVEVLPVLEDEKLHHIHMEENEATLQMSDARSKVLPDNTVPCRPVSFIKSLLINKTVCWDHFP